MNILDRYTSLWLVGIALAAVSVTFVFWQLSVLTPIVGLNLELIALWIDFLALIALYNKSRTWTLNLFGCSFVPLLAAGLVAQFFDRDTLLTPSANLMGGFALLLLFPPLGIYVSAMDFLPSVRERTSEPKAA